MSKTLPVVPSTTNKWTKFWVIHFFNNLCYPRLLFPFLAQTPLDSTVIYDALAGTDGWDLKTTFAYKLFCFHIRTCALCVWATLGSSCHCGRKRNVDWWKRVLKRVDISLRGNCPRSPCLALDGSLLCRKCIDSSVEKKGLPQPPGQGQGKFKKSKSSSHFYLPK